MKYNHLTSILPYIDDAFKAFYDTMLNDVKLAVFFDTKEQVVQLIEKQKVYFKASLNMESEQLKIVYTKLGEMHYDMRIPYVDFIRGTDILEEQFLLNSRDNKNSKVLMEEIFSYFKIMKSYTARGYLNRMLLEDKKDIDTFFEHATMTEGAFLPQDIIFEKIKWLKELLEMIENDEDFDIDTETTVLKLWLDQVNFLSLEKRKFFEDLENRMVLNTQSLFYFLKKEEYLEILPLYSSLLSIYKLALMMNNAITIEYANKVIDEMQVDALTGLQRKDMFGEFITQEIQKFKRKTDSSVFSLAIIDIDKFKNVNDTYGHYSGDQVLKDIGRIILKNIRSTDIGFRIGGDEFAIIFKGATKEATQKVCRKIMEDLKDIDFVFNEKTTFKVTLSIGVMEYSLQNGDDWESFYKLADKMMYNSKESGRNQIKVN